MQILLSPRARTRALAITVLVTWILALYMLANIGPAYAADGVAETSSPVQALAVLNLVVSFVLPLVIQLVTNSHASEQAKTLITLAISAIVGALTPFLTGVQTWPPSDWWAVFISAASVFLASVLAHQTLWKPLQVTGSTGAIANAVPGGIGGTGGAPAAEEPPAAAPDVTLGAVANPNVDPVVAPNPAAGLADDSHVQDTGEPPVNPAGQP